MGHEHYHSDPSRTGEHPLWWAVGVNILLTFAQIIGEMISGSLSLADRRNHINNF